MKDRKWVSEIWKRDKVKHETVTYREEHPVELFQMEIDETHFGKLKAVKI